MRGGELRGAPHDLLDGAHRKRRAGEHVVDPARYSRVELGAWYHLVDEADAIGFRRRDTFAGEQHTHREMKRHLALQQGHAAVERQAADARFRQSKRCFLRSDDDVAAEHHLESAADRVAVDARDHRDVERLAQRDAAESARPRQRPVFEPARAAAALHIRAGREGALARAGEHDDAHVAIALDLAPDLLQLALGLSVDGVEHLRPVDGDAGDVILDLE